MSVIKVSVIGCGSWGQNLIRNYTELGVLHSVHDIDESRATLIAKKFNTRSLSLEAILNSDVDAIVIATPASTHHLFGKKALLAGKHIFIEKPLALSLSEARELCLLAQSFDRILMVGHLMQYHPAFVKLKKLINNGDIGKLRYMYSTRLNLGKFRLEENILWSFAPHDVSMVLALTNEMPSEIYASGSHHIKSGIHDVATMQLKFLDGPEAYIFASWLYPFKEQKLVVIGDRNMVIFNDGESWDQKLQLCAYQINWDKGYPEPIKGETISVPLKANEPLKLECQHFINCILNHSNPITDGAEAVRVLEVLTVAQDLLTRKANMTVPRESAFPFLVAK